MQAESQEPQSHAQFLNEHGIRPSVHRLQIWTFLQGTKAHPSVDRIYAHLQPGLPTLSRTTVYNTLSLFVERGIAQALSIKDGEARYDADTSPHGHFHCRVCGEVFDFPLTEKRMKLKLPEGFIPERSQLFCYGCCPGCSGSTPMAC